MAPAQPGGSLRTGQNRGRTPVCRLGMGAEGSTLAGAEEALVGPAGGSTGRGKVAQRRLHAPEFKAAIVAFAAPPPPPAATAAAAPGIAVAVRKRPLFEHETERGDFDVIGCERQADGSGGVWLHRALMRADMRHMLLEHYDFGFDAVFSETDDTDAVYAGGLRNS